MMKPRLELQVAQCLVGEVFWVLLSAIELYRAL